MRAIDAVFCAPSTKIVSLIALRAAWKGKVQTHWSGKAIRFALVKRLPVSFTPLTTFSHIVFSFVGNLSSSACDKYCLLILFYYWYVLAFDVISHLLMMPLFYMAIIYFDVKCAFIKRGIYNCASCTLLLLTLQPIFLSLLISILRFCLLFNIILSCMLVY